jgi:NADH-quinone oxidoreductase subunit M
MLQKVFFGPLPSHWREFRDLAPSEATALAVLAAFIVAIGVFPRWLLDLVQASSIVLVSPQ